MTPFVIAVLKYAFLALLYFFVYRAVRGVAVQMGSPKPAGRAEARPKARGKAPSSVVVKDEGGKKRQSVRLSTPVQVGRAEACHIRLQDDVYVSQFHARIYPKDGAWYVEDLGSTNGTYLNRHRVTGAVEVKAGDELRVGKTVLELRR